MKELEHLCTLSMFDRTWPVYSQINGVFDEFSHRQLTALLPILEDFIVCTRGLHRTSHKSEVL